MTELLDPKVLLAAYDSQLRAREEDELPDGLDSDWDGPIKRTFGAYGFLEYNDLDGIEGAELDALIARQIEFFKARGQQFEWKTRSHDLPADLTDRLLAFGFVTEDRETVVIGLSAPYANPAPAVEGVKIREVTERPDFDGIVDLDVAVYGEDRDVYVGRMDRLASEVAKGLTRVFVAEADGKVVSAAWIRPVPGTDFAGLWGGSTAEEYRGRGIYKALVAVRAAVAATLGHKYLQVDCTEYSRPILERLGFVSVTHTTPYIWRP